MTIFGYDCSEHQDGLDHAQAYREGYRFCIARTSQGTYRDPAFKRHMAAARKAGLLFAAYVRTGTTSAPDEQAAVVAEQIGDTRVPVFIDTEDHPNDEARNYQIAKAIEAHGYRVIGSYLPEWFWGQIGKPTIRTGPLWASHYVAGAGLGPALYKTVPRSYWAGYGGQKIELLQFTDKATIAGRAVDASAYRGSLASLRKLFHGTRSKSKVATLTKIVTTLAGTPLDLSEVPTGKGIRFKFRDRLTNIDGAYPGCVCDCIPAHIALVEALAKEAGLPVPLTFWEGSFIDRTPSSGTTHAGGGAYDINIDNLTPKQVWLLSKIERIAGGMAYLRDWAHGRFPTKHIHVELIGCPHASPAARVQWGQYKNGRNGLSGTAEGPDYGPKVGYITAAKAYKKLTRTGTAPADSEDWLEMATQKEVQAALVAAIRQELSGDGYPSPSLDPDSVKKNPNWTLHSTVYWLVKLVSLIRRDMPTKAQIDELIQAVKEGK